MRGVPDATTGLRTVSTSDPALLIRRIFPVFSVEQVLPLVGVDIERPRTIGRSVGLDGIQVDDRAASRRHARIQIGEDGHAEVIDLGSRNGTTVNGQAVERKRLMPSSVIRIGDSLFVYAEISLPANADGFVVPDDASISWALSNHFASLAAPSMLPVLLQGPTGTGKELLAQRIHEASGREGELVPVNCGSLASELVASELFGHESGAFSGAKGSRAGLFAAADGGTLFLDEIGELPRDQQPALLRVLQEGRIRPVGSDRERTVDVRVISATHRPLRVLAAEGRFRQDLYFRLAGFDLETHALTERREDILRLFSRFSTQSALTADAAEALLFYAWPGNVRELKAVAAQARLVAAPGRIAMSHLPVAVREFEMAEGPVDEDAAEPTIIRQPSRDELIELLRTHDGNIASVGRVLGRHRQQVYRWLKRLDIQPDDYR